MTPIGSTMMGEQAGPKQFGASVALAEEAGGPVSSWNGARIDRHHQAAAELLVGDGRGHGADHTKEGER